MTSIKTARKNARTQLAAFSFSTRYGVYVSTERYTTPEEVRDVLERLQPHTHQSLDCYREYNRESMEACWFIYSQRDISHKVRIIKCPICGLREELKPKRLNKLCERCSYQQPYSTTVTKRKYESHNGLGLTFGFELELACDDNTTNQDYQQLQERLIKAGFARTADGTVTDEYKSPIFGVPHIPGNLQKILTLASGFTSADNVGTHIHIGGMARYANRRRHTYDIFCNLEQYLATHEESTVAIWGRDFGSFRHYPMTSEHGSWLAGRRETWEFRLARLVTYTQFAKLVKFLTTICMFIDTPLSNPTSDTYDDVADEVLAKYIAFFNLPEDQEDRTERECYQNQDEHPNERDFLNRYGYDDLRCNRYDDDDSDDDDEEYRSDDDEN